MTFPGLGRLLIGKPIPTEEAAHHRLPKFLALPVFASDAMSSSCYATEEILIVLNRHLLPVVGAAALGYSIPIAIGIAVLLTIVTISYRQTVQAYPGGGGAYIVARDNLGEGPAQVAGAALLTDYVLTVAVSIAAGVAAITSAFPPLFPHRVALCVAFIAVMTIVNLRGVKESGWFAAVPVYGFLTIMGTMLAVGGLYLLRHGAPPVPAHLPGPAPAHASLSSFAFGFIIMHAFANGCAALTGVEAISNGVTAFKPPEAKNAAATMVWMSAVLCVFFLGLTVLARAFHVTPIEHETVISQTGRLAYGGGPLYYCLQAATAGILILAANTAFADFPRLANLAAADGFLPRQLSQLGDRLVYHNGIIVLGGVAALLCIMFHGTVDKLIPLYAVGVFLSFTLSQSGMVKRWFRLREARWQLKAAVNGLGAVCCAVVMLVFATTKFAEGAWIVVIMIPAMVFVFFRIHRHYQGVARMLSLEGAAAPQKPSRHRVMVLISGVHRGLLPALAYARAIDTDPEAVYVELRPGQAEAVRKQWAQWGQGMRLTVLESPVRRLMQPILGYINRTLEEEHLDLLTVVIPEFVVTHPIHSLLHNQSGWRLKLALLYQPRVVVVNVPYHLRDEGPGASS
ncbi:MAG: APC family permease [Armatimonadetes bacterium]|nr:APC family permease [Armatimonadota bacterium]